MNFLKELFTFIPASKADAFSLSNDETTEFDVREEKNVEKNYVSTNIEENLAYIRRRYNIPLNDDVILREIALKDGRQAFVIFFEGMVNSQAIDDYIIKSLIGLSHIQDADFDDEQYKYFTTHAEVTVDTDMDNVAEGINFGSCALFVDGVATSFVFDVKQWEHRGIDKPENYQSIYGPQEAFGEMMRTNTALIRKTLKT